MTISVNSFNDKLQEASRKIGQLTDNYSSAIDVMEGFNASLDALREYREQIMRVNNTLSELNAIYEAELQDVQKHLNTINRFYNSIGGVMENMASEEVVQGSQRLAKEIVSLADNMQNLNKVYGDMLNSIARFSL